ncbi:type I-C CRISPR-associated protein Cas7/Csd2 [Kurthia massiliensis]|uniref:type I-C CRISPR-associated protein Cas7/Csd2 n=1 Tax=Kurthia massiliensis TaxID=1033739 RepID=UPI000288B9A7|nr:type I-C CRISPR-associated protein Cas7/Csd2 [Kurthia massiliensis]
MTVLDHKIDFSVIFTVKNANPNGDPLNGNRPRQNFDGYGEVSDVAIKRKIRNRAQDLLENIFVQSNDNTTDGFKSLRERANTNETLKEAEKAKDEVLFAKAACEAWYDVRAFGQVFAFKAEKKGAGVSVGIRGPVSIHPAISIEPINIVSTQITKSTNSEPGEKKGSDTMGMKHRVESGVYRFSGSINTQLAEKTGFTNEDAERLKEILQTLFENDASSARPEGSIEVRKVFWWEHASKLGNYSSAKVHRSLKIEPKSNIDEPFTYTIEELDGLPVQVYEGI